MDRPDDDDRSGDDARKAAVNVLRKLRDGGHVAYLAGGCVRDRLMGLTPRDYDVATDARPEQVLSMFPRAQRVGESFGVQLVRHRGHVIEVATFRTEGRYHDGRHPEEVEFSDAEHDARRRDFTINGLFEDPLTGAIIDYVGGQRDLAARVVNAIGDPALRMREDQLRMLRAIRFAARFGFSIDAGTADTIRSGAEGLRGVSRERVGHELRWMFEDPNRAVAAWEMQYLGIDRAVLLEDNRLDAPCRLGRLPDAVAFPTALGAWLVDRNDGCPEPLKDALDRCTAALKLSGAERRDLMRCLEVFRDLRGRWSRLGVAAQKRLAARRGFSEGLSVLRAEDAQAFVDVRRRITELEETGLAPAALLTGDDLVDDGFRPGPSFKRILDAVYDAQLEGSIGSREEALALARMIRASGVDGGPASPPEG